MIRAQDKAKLFDAWSLLWQTFQLDFQYLPFLPRRFGFGCGFKEIWLWCRLCCIDIFEAEAKATHFASLVLFLWQRHQGQAWVGDSGPAPPMASCHALQTTLCTTFHVKSSLHVTYSLLFTPYPHVTALFSVLFHPQIPLIFVVLTSRIGFIPAQLSTKGSSRQNKQIHKCTLFQYHYVLI